MNIKIVITQSFFIMFTLYPMVIPSSSTPCRHMPLHYERQRYSPFSASLQAAYDGTMAQWTRDKIIQAAQEQHPDTGDTIAHVAHNTDTLAAILEACPSLLEARNYKGNTILHQFAARTTGIDLVIFALQFFNQYPNGINNALNGTTNYFGDLPVHIAAASGQFYNIRVLVEFGAILSYQNSKRETPAQISNRLRQRDLNAELRQWKTIKPCHSPSSLTIAPCSTRSRSTHPTDNRETPSKNAAQDSTDCSFTVTEGN